MAKRKRIETSVDAYNSLHKETLAQIYQDILWGLSQINEGSFEDIALVIKKPKEKVWKRLGELSKMNLIYRPGNKKKLSSGREGYTWKLVGSTDPVKVTERAIPGKSVSDYSSQLIQTTMF